MKATLNTSTILNRTEGEVRVYTFYSDVERYIEAFLLDEEKNINGVSFVEGEGGYTNFNFENTSFFVNKFGELLVKSDEASKFSLDELTGQLQITE